MIKVIGISCRITGTDDYHYSKDYPQCKDCSYSKMCQSQFNEEELTIAQGNLEEGQKMIEEGQMLVDMARKVFEKAAIENDLAKYQFNHYMINRLLIPPITSYPKAKLLKHFTLDQLEPCKEIREAAYQLRINDLLKVKEKSNDS